MDSSYLKQNCFIRLEICMSDLSKIYFMSFSYLKNSGGFGAWPGNVLKLRAVIFSI